MRGKGDGRDVGMMMGVGGKSGEDVVIDEMGGFIELVRGRGGVGVGCGGDIVDFGVGKKIMLDGEMLGGDEKGMGMSGWKGEEEVLSKRY